MSCDIDLSAKLTAAHSLSDDLLSRFSVIGALLLGISYFLYFYVHNYTPVKKDSQMSLF